MPSLNIRNAADVPAHIKSSAAVRAQQSLYEGFIREAGTENVGELHLADGENERSVKVRLRRAASRVGATIEIWDNDGKVYFRNIQTASRRGRPRKQSVSA